MTTFNIGLAHTMKIIITGTTGSLGAALTRYYSELGHEVIACGRDTYAPDSLLVYASYLSKDITRPFELPDADVCIHTAALSDDKADYPSLYNANVNGTKHTVLAAERCKTFIHISSSSVYLPEAEPINENMAGRQNNNKLSPYGRSKLEAEKVLISTTKHAACFILRPRAFYGAGDRVILPRLLKLVQKDTFRRPGKMEVAVSLTHYLNIAKAIDCCIASSKQGVHIYNVADDRSYVLVEIVRKIIREVYGRDLKEKEISILFLKLLAVFKIGGITPLLVRSFTKNMVLDLTKIKTELGYQAVIDFDAQLKDLGDWVRRIGGVEILKTGDRKLAWIK
ncbi:MAG: NAD(P)-dependent oxidoreductase [bacterium]|nr:NAD(P)-dependent oxidoreductase [bacterium]